MERDLPTNWAVATLDELSDVVAGNPAPQGAEFFEGGTYPFVRVFDMGKNNGQVHLRKTRDLVNEKAAKNLKVFPAGSILFTKSGASTLLNQRAILATDSFVVSHIAASIPVIGVDSKWLYYWLTLIDFATLAHATNMPSLPLSRAKNIEIPFAPFSEQKRIIAKIEELFSELDNGIESLKTAREQLKVYRQVMLKHAFEGKLTANWREQNKDKLETADQLLARVKSEREARYQQQQSDWKAAVKKWEEGEKESRKPKKPKVILALTKIEISELPQIPEGWVWSELCDLSLKITDGEHFRPPVQDHGIYFLSAKDVRESGVSLDDPLYIDEDTAQKARLRCDPEKGDILIVSRGATVGRMCVVDIDDEFCLLGSVILIKVIEQIESLYLVALLKSPRINQAIVSLSGATAQQAIYLRDIQHVAVPICSQAEQREISKILDEKFSITIEVEAAIELEIRRSESLRQSILKKAFSGQLVEQDPNDEPASILLERIKRRKGRTSHIHKTQKKEKRMMQDYYKVLQLERGE